MEAAIAIIYAITTGTALALVGLYATLRWIAARIKPPKPANSGVPALRGKTKASLDERARSRSLGKRAAEILVAALLHPVAVVLMWLHLAGRRDLNDLQRIIWALAGLLWGIGPALYVLLANGALW